MKKIIAMIIVCFGFFGCTHYIGMMTDKNYYSTMLKKANASKYNAQLACYQLYGIVEARNFIVDGNVVDEWQREGYKIEKLQEKINNKPKSKSESINLERDLRKAEANSLKYRNTRTFSNILQMAKVKAAHTKNSQAEQCLKLVDELNQKFKDECNSKFTNSGSIGCFEDMGKEFNKIAKETNLKLKNVVFTCSQGDEVFEKFAPKFFRDEGITNYALDTLQFKPIVAKEFSQDISKMVSQDLDKNLFKDIDEKATDKFIKEQSDDLRKGAICMYKMRYYGGDLEELDMFRKSGLFAADIARGYWNFKENIKEKNNENSNAAVFVSSYRKSYKINTVSAGPLFSEEFTSITKGMSAGAIVEKLEKINNEIEKAKSKYRAYSKQEKQKQNNNINKKITELIVEKRTLEAMLKFVKEQ